MYLMFLEPSLLEWPSEKRKKIEKKELKLTLCIRSALGIELFIVGILRTLLILYEICIIVKVRSNRESLARL